MRYFKNTKTSQVFGFDDTESAKPYIEKAIKEGMVECEAPVQPAQPSEAEIIAASVTATRANAYRNESDPLFFKAQRGECSMDDWKAKVAEIKKRIPDGVMPI